MKIVEKCICDLSAELVVKGLWAQGVVQGVWTEEVVQGVKGSWAEIDWKTLTLGKAAAGM